MTLNPLILQKMNTPHHASSIEILKSIALEAGAIVRKGFAASKEITHKGTVDLVTQYDVATEQFIIEKLRAAFPEHTLIGEETHRGDFGTVFEKAIYIDPIDGTTNFVHGIPHVAISIGVYEHGEGVMGVVYNPILDELFCAVRGEGACCNGKTIHVSTQDTLQQALIATGFPYSKPWTKCCPMYATFVGSALRHWIYATSHAVRWTATMKSTSNRGMPPPDSSSRRKPAPSSPRWMVHPYILTTPQ